MAKLTRRAVVVGAAALAQIRAIGAQAQGRVWRLGWLSAVQDDAELSPFRAALLGGLREHGYELGRNLAIDVRFAGGDSRRYPALAEELVALAPDVLCAATGPALALMKKTATIPIVVLLSGDPVAEGLAERLDRPGGNVTGIGNWVLTEKLIELLTELVPQCRRAAMLTDTQTVVGRVRPATLAAARSKGIELMVEDASDAASFRSALARFAEQGAQGLLVAYTSTTYLHRELIVATARELRLPAIAPVDAYADAGGLASVGVGVLDATRQAAGFIARIFGGAKPGDLPFELASRFELVVNLKTAAEIGLTLPPHLLARAYRVIE